ncbi:MAG: efflux RND transporter permease subunit [Rickettsiales bacterium]|jgi:multidrug efflux pump subunit AcrB|nr:efflux RND transporter permease subunit [Rickettsiales bacterium]
MNFSRFFVDRPIFAGVLSALIFIAGLIAIPLMPISEYPDVVPPTVEVSAQYPGANPKVISETVAAPLEEQINGVEGMLYMSSQGTSDGVMRLTVTFKIGTDPDKAQQLVENRVSQALPRLPEEVRQFGVTTVKSSPDLTMVVHLLSPDGSRDMLYQRNYAVLNVKDALARVRGVGQVAVFGSGDYAMRIWLNPEKMAARGLAATDVVMAVREQNVQVAAGVVGGPPYAEGTEIQLNVSAQGRLQNEEEFGEIVLKVDPVTGGITRLRDVARIELGASEYGLRSLLDNKQAVAIPIFQAPGSNAIQISDDIRSTMAELKKDFPAGLDYSVVYDPTVFVRDSIKAVIVTLLEAVALVVLVVIVFLQTWRASIIPLLAVPVSIVGTFAFMYAFGFSINALSLFGLVLAIGIVVDDAIVVVENVERNIEEGLSPRDATYQAMREVSGPIIAIALTLIAVFVPIAFMSGLTGQFYQQFALTIAISTVISAFNSLTLSPALAAMLLKPKGLPKDRLTLVIEKIFGGVFAAWRWFGLTILLIIANIIVMKILGNLMGFSPILMYLGIGFSALIWISFIIGAVLAIRHMLMPPVAGTPQGFDRFNRFFGRQSERYSLGVQSSLSRKRAFVMGYTLLIGVTALIFQLTPKGFIPQQDKQYLVSFAMLPDGANLDRTEEVMRKMSDIMMKQPGVASAVAFPGLSIKGFTNSPSAGITFVSLKPFEERTTPDLSAGAISGSLMGQYFMQIKEAFPVLALPPPPVMGLSTTGGAKLQIQDRADLGYEALDAVKNEILGKARQSPVFDPQGGAYSLYGINVPQLEVKVDRVRAKQMGVAITDIFATLQIYLGSAYINDFNKFGRTYRVFAQADSEFRARASDMLQLKVRSASGEMIPLGALIKITESYGPDNATRYNAYRSADINVSPAAGFSTGQVRDEIERIVKETLPRGMTFEWTELTYQEILAGNTALLIFPLCVLLVFMVLAAQYESLVLPLAVILIVPMCLLSAIFGVWIVGRDNNIFTQIGLIVLVGLACKNAILIVEFARELEIIQKLSPFHAAIKSCRLRLRPILMTSFAFIMGVLPLVFSSGAGSEMRQDMGVAVFSGMLGVTFFGLFLTPIFYVGLRMMFGGQLHSASLEHAHHHEGERRE